MVANDCWIVPLHLCEKCLQASGPHHTKQIIFCSIDGMMSKTASQINGTNVHVTGGVLMNNLRVGERFFTVVANALIYKH